MERNPVMRTTRTDHDKRTGWAIPDALVAVIVLAVVAMGLCALSEGSDAASSGTCGDDLTWEMDDDGNLTISGTGPMRDYSKNDPSPMKGATSVSIGGSVTSIGDYAFSGSTLKTLVIPDSVETIGDRAFYAC